MPWCDPCDRYMTPTSLDERGCCRVCGSEAEHHRDEPTAAPGRPTIPWHFWVLVASLVMYLGWRLIQALGWLVGLI